MPSPFEGKRVLLLSKAVSMCFEPHCLNSSLAGRVSDGPDVGCSICGERSRETLALCGTQAISVRVIVQSSAQKNISWSRFYFCSLLKTNFTNKEEKKTF